MAPLSVLACDRDCAGPIWAFAGLGLYCLCVFFFFGSCAASRLGSPLGYVTFRHLTSHWISMDPIRQFEDNSASPPAAQLSSQPGMLPGSASSPPHASGIMADIIVALLADRPDAAQILASVALRLAPAARSVGQPLQHEQPAMLPGAQPSSSFATPSVAVVKELSRSQRDAALLEDAVDLSSPSSPSCRSRQ